MRKSSLLVGALAALEFTSLANGGIVYDNRGNGVDDIANETITTDADAPNIQNVLDDGTFGPGVTGAQTLNAVDIGYANLGAGTENFDILVQFYNSVNYSAGPLTTVGSAATGSQFRIPIVGADAQDVGETGLIPLVGTLPTITGGSFGIQLKFVNTGTTTLSTDIVPVFTNAPGGPIGTSNNDFAYDSNGNGAITGNEVRTFANSPDAGDPAASLYLAVNSVPEPVGLLIVAASAAAVLGRHRREVN